MTQNVKQINEISHFFKLLTFSSINSDKKKKLKKESYQL